MNFSEIGKIVGAVTGAVVFVLVIGFIGKAIYTPIKDNGPGYNLPEPEIAQVAEATEEPAAQEQPAPTEQAATAEQPAATEESATTEPVAAEEPAAPEPVSFAALLAASSVEAGKKVSRKCAACHNLKPGGKTLVGPPLWGIVGQAIGGNADYKYSAIFKELNASGEIWTYENLNEFFTSPKTFSPKTKMTFGGVKSDEDRANLLAYFQSLSENPVPFPTE